MARHGKTATAAAAAIAVAAGGCGTAHTPNETASAGPATSASSTGTTPPTVLAAASLSRVLPEIDPRAKYTFGGSSALAADIVQGAPADVFASASPKQTSALFNKGLVGKPVEFATNRLVLVVPRADPAHVRSVADVTRPGVKLVICAAAVPCGDYARKAFANLGITAAAMRNVVSQTSDVSQALAEVALGQADAGFVYVTDVKAAGGRVTAIALPAKAKPKGKDYIAVVKDARDPAAARAFVAAVLSPAGRARLRAAGFGAP